MTAQPTIPCRTNCGRQTAMLGTKLCDHCWELQRRLPDLLRLLVYNDKARLAGDLEETTDKLFGH